MKGSNLSTQLRENTFGIVYTLFLLLFGAVINYFTWTDEGEMTGSTIFLLFLIIVLLYLPIVFLTHYANWQIREFGFVVNGWALLIAILLIGVSIFTSLSAPGTDLQESLIEAIVRTGEELFFRGFIYALVVRILADRKERHAQIWAVLLSSIAFAIVHTQTFLPEHNDTMLMVLMLALLLGFVRFLTGSILPGIILHLLFNTGEVVAVLMGCVIYGLFVFWSYWKGEDHLDPISLR